MEEQGEEREFVGDCREPVEEKAKKGLALSSQTETLDGEDARTVEVLVDSGFGENAKTVEVLVDSGVTDGNANDGGSATETVSDEKQVKVDVASVEKTVSSDDVDVIDGSEICDDVQRVRKTAKLVEADVNDETAIAGAEESVISGGNEVKAKCEVEGKCGAYDGETHSVAEERESAKKTEEEETPGPETKDAKHSESVPVLEESTQLSEEGTVSEFGSAADICREEERTNVNQKEGEAMELDCVLDNARNHLQNMMEGGVSGKPLPTDLITEIFLRLPAKSVGRFRCLSKQWCSVLSGPDFIKLFQSRAHPRLMFAVERKGSWSFFSAPQPSSSSLVVTADFHSRFSEDVSRFMTLSYASGLFYFKYLWNPKVGAESLVCNPITGRYVILPEVYMYRKSIGFIGFDPIGKEYKVLAEGHPFCGQRDHHEVLTLGGTGELSWRPKGTDTPSYDRTVCEGICIDGVLYYLVENFDETLYSIVRFDFRSEEFKVLAVDGFSDPNTTRLVNYKGKLGWIEWDYGEADGKYTLALRLCVLEDVEREKWSEYEYTLPENKLMGDTSKVSVAGVTATGEIVLVMDYTCKPYYIFYFNPKRNTLQSVEIQGFGAFEALEYRGRVTAFVDHVEDLNVDDAVQLKSKGVFANQVRHLCSNCEEQKKQERQ